ncbi:MAG TPA: chromate resistance protein ChrB domain-containing protein [Vicinamibacterales bacterium]|nr:chromate resistance protein ChrB domain-containing protein [Vicinamibacterales bacterium]
MTASARWLLLVHQLPARPLYLRAQVRRRLAQVGALPLKNSVYVLPDRPECLEDFQWIAQEAVAGGGEASVCRAEFIGDAAANDLRARFLDDARSRFMPIRTALETQLDALRRRRTSGADANLARVQRLAEQAARLDFFNSELGAEVQTLMAAIKKRLRPSPGTARRGATKRTDLEGRVWVTRRDPHIDRLATAWLVRRFVDPAARFRFVDPAGGAVRQDEKSFDMIGADFTHEGDRCSFETMCARLGLNDAALHQLAEIVHDLDLKDGKFGRADAAGVQRLVDGLSAAHPDSSARVTAALPIFDALFASFGGRLPAAGARSGRRARARARR